MLLSSASFILTQTNPAAVHGLNTAGWIFISLAWISIISVAVFCYSKVIRIAEQRKRERALQSGINQSGEYTS